jgi:hypothetical protein
MARTFLKILPLEIRDQIYRYVLVSPSGLILLPRTSYHNSYRAVHSIQTFAK